MIAPSPQREHVAVIGVLCPEKLYDTKAVLRHAGIGRTELAEARRVGKIRRHRFGTRNWYRGADLIALIESNED